MYCKKRYSKYQFKNLYKTFLYLIKLYYICRMKKLEELTYIEYTALQTSGVLKVVYPQATGVYSVDCQKSENDDLMKVEQNDIEK